MKKRVRLLSALLAVFMTVMMLAGSAETHASGNTKTYTNAAEIMQLVYIDDRSCGRSERVDINTSSIKQNVDDIEALREYLGLDKIFILGQSYGGFKAQKYIID